MQPSAAFVIHDWTGLDKLSTDVFNDENEGIYVFCTDERLRSRVSLCLVLLHLFGCGKKFAVLVLLTSVSVPVQCMSNTAVQRVERLDHGGVTKWAKIIGTLVSILGAIIVTFYTGPAIITSHLTSIAPQNLLGQSSEFILGGVLMLIDCVLAALFIIAQAVILKRYSAVLILMLAYCSIITVLSLLASLILEHDLSAFSLQSKTRFLAILYAGCFGAGFQLTIGAWCVKMKGPLFVAMFHPLGIVIAAIMGVIFLGDSLYLGSLLGSGVIVIGFYGVMWGKGKEDRIVEGNMIESSKTPLLQDDIHDDNVMLP